MIIPSSRTADPSDSVVSFSGMTGAHEPYAGGKGGTLARLRQAGYGVPDGFVILSNAFSGDELSAEAWKTALAHLARLRRGGKDASFAVRSSAVCEDSEQASYAGEFETVLDVRTDEEFRGAVRAVRCSRHSVRVEAYGRAQGVGGAGQEIAVVVQRMVRADFSGVLFTVDPVSGNVSVMAGNFVEGGGEKLVSGNANPRTFAFARPRGRYEGPGELARAARALYRAACGLERDLGVPQDIEWAVCRGRLSILQSRPITTLGGFKADTCEWNASRTGRFLWSATNLAEQAPEVRTPFSCSLLDPRYTPQAFRVGGYLLTGIICGRAYSNLSVMLSAYAPLFGGNARRASVMLSATFGAIPADIDIPLIPITAGAWWTRVLPGLLGYVSKMRRLKNQIPDFAARNPDQCARMRRDISRTSRTAGLAELWKDRILPYFQRGLSLLLASTIDISPRLERKLRGLAGPEDAGILLSNLSGLSGGLESLGPVAGISKVAGGTMGRDEYGEAYGHRGVNEFEYAWPRPMEDPAWLDRRIEEFRKNPVDVEAMFGKQRAAFDAAWERLVRLHPREAKSVRESLERAARAARIRESIRSEAIRIMSVIRAFALRAGELTGAGGDVFFLTIDECLALLSGVRDAARFIPARKASYEKYRALPQYPSIIVGRFDPFAWAADPHRRTDLFDADAPAASGVPVPADSTGVIRGLAGAPGVREGVVRFLARFEDGDQFQAGEILLTSMTNIGWTLLFPRAAAIITDIGAPLSHASIVARELGIPAVVGCGNATSRLRTGDRVRVDGGKGLVEIIRAAL